MENIEGRFLKNQYWSKEEFRQVVEKSTQKGNCLAEGELEIPRKPEEKILSYLERIEKVTGRVDSKTGEKGRLFLEIALYPKYIIKPENISDEYIKGILLGNFAEKKGYELNDLRNEEIKQRVLAQFQQETGQSFESYQLPDEEREQIKDMIITDQKARLKTWFNYLTSEEARNVPAAFRYWAFAEMLKLGSFDETRKVFNKRTENTAASFPELNQQALALVFDEVQRKLQGEPSQIQMTDATRQDEFKKLLHSTNFGKLYAFFLEYIKSLRLPTERLMITEGEWRYFPQGTPANQLTSTIEGFNTGWCIAGEGYAQNYLSQSDLWIYYSKDQTGHNTIPRACIVVSKEHGITEVRGILSDENAKQHLDSYIVPVVEDKLKTLPGGKKWQETMEDMKRLARIHFKHLQNEPLSKEDLRFIYEIDRPIKSSGYQRDPRIGEIRHRRDIKEDLSLALEVPKDQISLTQKEALQGNIVYHYGDLDLNNLTSAQDLTLPKSVGGYLNLNGLTSAEGLTLPETIGGYLDLSHLTSAQGLTLPKSVGGNLYLNSLTSAQGLTLPETIGGSLYLRNLTSAQGLTLPETIGGSLDLSHLTSAEGLTLPKSVGGYLNLDNLTSAEGLTLPKSVGRNLNLSHLTSAEGLTLPETIGGNLDLSHLTSAEGLTLPETIGGNLNLSHLTSAEGLTLPEFIGGNLDLRHLTSAEGLTLPETIGGSLDLSHLTSAEGLTLPETIGGSLDLNSLTSAQGLILPESIDGNLDLNSLTSAEGLTLPKSVGRKLNLSHLTSAEGLTLPKSIGGDLYLFSLTSAEGLTLPEFIGGNLYLNGLTSAEGLTLPETIGGGIYLYHLNPVEKTELIKNNPHLANKIH